VEHVWPAVEAVASGPHGTPTPFEVLTAMAFTAFAAHRCAFQVVEAGIGARLDATNVVPRPLLSVITTISLDHTELLGETIGQIAWDKAHAVKAGRPVVVAPQRAEAFAAIRAAATAGAAPLVDVARDYAWERGASDRHGQEVRIATPAGTVRGWTPLLGRHQLENAACAVATCDVLRAEGVALPPAAVRAGLTEVRWPGRLELLATAPTIVVDGAHNADAAARLAEAVREYLPHDRLLLVFGASADKDLAALVATLAPIGSHVLACRARHPRSRDPAEMLTLFAAAGIAGEAYPSVAAALQAGRAQAGADDLILATGSLFAVAEAREAVLGIPPEQYPELASGGNPSSCSAGNSGGRCGPPAPSP
jgi:dihydrofolate synthase/folylpolyglutamate synthase